MRDHYRDKLRESHEFQSSICIPVDKCNADSANPSSETKSAINSAHQAFRRKRAKMPIYLFESKKRMRFRKGRGRNKRREDNRHSADAID
jgi:hypothetical protein